MSGWRYGTSGWSQPPVEDLRPVPVTGARRLATPGARRTALLLGAWSGGALSTAALDIIVRLVGGG
jgi:hypothetical protein